MHIFIDTDTHVFLEKGENDQYMSENDDIMMETDDALSWKTKEFRKGYHNAITQFQKKYNLRSRKVSTEPQQDESHKETSGRHPFHEPTKETQPDQGCD
jgi:hypothetical protein